MDGDRERWNARWRERAGDLESASYFLVRHADTVGTRGKALDLAGGAGRNAIWLARRGLEVTLVDVSDVALDKAEQRAKRLGVSDKLKLVRLDLELPVPFAPLFDLVVVAHYLDRERRDSFAELLVDGGLLVAMNPTVTNLDRHGHPSARFLVERGELVDWVQRLGFEVLGHLEDWTDDGTHEAAVIARRTVDRARADEPIEQTPSEGPYR